MRGSVGGLKMTIRTKFLILHHTVLILVLSCIFLWSKNTFVKVLRKSDHSYSSKLPFKSKLEKEGALRLTGACSLNWHFQCHYHLDSQWQYPLKKFERFKPKRLTMAANFVLHRTSSLKCTGVNALSFPVHFNGSILKLLNLGTTVKRERVRCSDFQNMLLPGLSYT